MKNLYIYARNICSPSVCFHFGATRKETQELKSSGRQWRMTKTMTNSEVIGRAVSLSFSVRCAIP